MPPELAFQSTGLAMNNYLNYRPVLTAAMLLCLSGTVQAADNPMESDWIELVKGSRGVTMGAELMDIEQNADEATNKVTLRIPKRSMSDPDEIEEVVVIGKMPEKSEPMNVRYEWVRDYDEDSHGLIIHLGSEDTWPIRIFMNAVQEVEQ